MPRETLSLYKDGEGRPTGLAVLDGFDVARALEILSDQSHRTSRGTSACSERPVWAPFASTSGMDSFLCYFVPDGPARKAVHSDRLRSVNGAGASFVAVPSEFVALEMGGGSRRER